MRAGGYVVDTPGLRQFELWGVVPGELEGHFIEFRPYIPHCRFPDCSHTHETRCAVKEAVYWGQIHAGPVRELRQAPRAKAPRWRLSQTQPQACLLIPRPRRQHS